jgi:hypothetical protein
VTTPFLPTWKGLAMADDITPEPTFNPTALDDAALAAEFARVRERGTELASKAEHTAEEQAEFGALAERLPLIQAETAARIERANAAQAQRDAFASLGDVPVIPAVNPIPAPASVSSAPVVASEPVVVPQVPSVAEMAVQTHVAPPAGVARREGWVGRLMPHTAGLLQRGVGEEFSGINEISETLINSARSVGRNSSSASATLN